MKKNPKIGITANIGCGKSAVAALLANYPGVTVIDTDTVAKEIAALPKHAGTIQAIVGFPVNILNKEDRSKLAAALFANPEMLKAYEAFIHPLVGKRVDELAEAADGMVFVESALLFEAGTEHRYDKIIVVSCDPSVQVARLRDGNRKMSESDIAARMALQMPHAQKCARADYVVDNNGTPEQLAERVRQVYDHVKKLSGKSKPTKALYVGTFDPPTLGHQWLVDQACGRYDEVVVAVTVNPDKKTQFLVEERLEMLREIVPPFVTVRSFADVYSVDYAESIGARTLIRGVRNAVDQAYEETVARVNRRINPSVVTECIMAPDHLADVSSSMVKALIGPKGWEAILCEYVPPAVLVRLIAKHHGLFRNLQGLGAQRDEIGFWKKVVMPYLEPDRYYHTIGHIGSMIAEFNQVRDFCNDPIAVEYAIWMHDIFNDTMVRRHENEERSGRFARELAETLVLPNGFGTKVESLILATKHNRPVTDLDAQILVDLDLMILGAQPRIFQVYDEAIRNEYAWVDDETFNRRRSEILRAFRSKKRIYYTDLFHNRFKKQAWENLGGSIERLG